MKLCFQIRYEKDEIITVPIAHGEGNYYCDEETLAELKKNNQIVFTYEGTIQMEVLKILQVLQMKQGNVLGMMPHPERAVDELLGRSRWS